MPNTHMTPVKKTVTSADIGTDIELVDAVTQAVVNNITIFSDSDITKTYKVKIGGKQIGVAEDNSMFNDKQYIGVGEALTLELDEVPDNMRTIYVMYGTTLGRLVPSVTADGATARVSYSLDKTFGTDGRKSLTGNAPANVNFRAYKNLLDETINLWSGSNTIYQYNVDTDTQSSWTDASNIYEAMTYNESDGYIYYAKEGGHIFGRILASTMALDDTWEVTLDNASYSISTSSDMQSINNELWILPESTSNSNVAQKMVNIDIANETYVYTEMLSGFGDDPIGACLYKNSDDETMLVVGNGKAQSNYWSFGNTSHTQALELDNRILVRNLETGMLHVKGSQQSVITAGQYTPKARGFMISDKHFFQHYLFHNPYDGYYQILNIETGKEVDSGKVFANNATNYDTMGIDAWEDFEGGNSWLSREAYFTSVKENIGFSEKFGTTNIRLTGIDVGA